MELNNIENILKKYDAGKTTLEEEQMLKTYFSSNNIAPHLKAYKPLFNYFSKNKKEQLNKSIFLKRKPNINYKWVTTAAAILILCFYLKTPIVSLYKKQKYGTYNKPEKALNEISKSLTTISNYLNKGTQNIGYLKEVENTTQIIFKKQ